MIDFAGALDRTRGDDEEILQRLEYVLRREPREHFFLVGLRGSELFVFHAVGDRNEVSFEHAALVDWLNGVNLDDGFAVHSHVPGSSVYPSLADRRMTETLLELEPIREHFIIAASDDDIRFRIYCFSQRMTRVLDCLDDRRELRAARRRRR